MLRETNVVNLLKNLMINTIHFVCNLLGFLINLLYLFHSLLQLDLIKSLMLHIPISANNSVFITNQFLHRHQTLLLQLLLNLIGLKACAHGLRSSNDFSFVLNSEYLFWFQSSFHSLIQDV